MSAAPVTLAPRMQEGQSGDTVKTTDVLDIVERLHQAAAHPDVKAIRRYGRDSEPGGQSPPGVALTYRSGSEAYFAAVLQAAVEPVELPEAFDAQTFRARIQPALRLLVQLLGAAKPAEFTVWRTVGFPGVGASPCGLEIRCADGSTAYLRVTSGFGGNAALDVDGFPEYRIPAAVGA